MIGDRIDQLTQELQEVENPCCDCKESGMSTTCRCNDKIKYDVWLAKEKIVNVQILQPKASL